MRGLTPGQRSALKKAVTKYRVDNGTFPTGGVWDLPEYETIEAMNCTEVFVQKADQFIYDMYFKAVQENNGRML